MKLESLAIELIVIDGGTQIRTATNSEHAAEFSETWKSSPTTIPPPVVFHDGKTYWMADGFHRFLGAVKAERASIKCEVHQGTLRDAILYACGANQTHGLKRTSADKRCAVERLLADPEWASWSNKRIAEAAGVGASLVDDIRKVQLPESGSSISENPTKQAKTRTGRDGKQRPATQPTKTKKITGGSTFDVKELETPDEKIEPKKEKPVTLAERTKEMNREVESFAKRLLAEFDGNVPEHPWLCESLIGIARDQIRSACSTIRQAKTVDDNCPKCEGNGCKTCRQCGSLPKNSHLMAGG